VSILLFSGKSYPISWYLYWTVLLFGVAFAKDVSNAEEIVRLSSPNGAVAAFFKPGEQINYSVTFHGQTVVEESTLGILVDGHDLATNAVITREPRTEEIRGRYATRGVHAFAVNRCRVTLISLESGTSQLPWTLEFRVFDDGVAYRYRVPGEGTRHIDGEHTEWHLPGDAVIWYQAAEDRSYEALYQRNVVDQLTEGSHLMVPAVVKYAGGAGYAVITEANLVDYSDMALQVSAGNRLRAEFQDDPSGWDFEGEIVSPWRVTLVASDLNGLVNSDIVKNLCPPPNPELADAAWIRPGRSTWHWLTGGAPKLEEQKSWIDGAKKLGFQYHLIDDGWRNWNGGGEHAWEALAELVKYARSQDVDLWVWVDSKYVFTHSDRAAYFNRAKQVGIVGLKIDFPKPANQEWVRWYDDTLRDAVSAKLMVDFHGAVKPTGRERTWPNEMTREAVRGREHGKLPSTHDTTLPFVRYVQGHADYTPALLIPSRLDGSSSAHELAMAVVFTSPFLCMGDIPQHYLDSDASDVIAALPPTWDETLVLPGSEIGELAAFARRKDQQWFVGVINGSTARHYRIDLNFLGHGSYSAVELADDSDRNDAFVRSEQKVTCNDQLSAQLRADGGFVVWLNPVKRKLQE
jgi:alpha-glucosidase